MLNMNEREYMLKNVIGHLVYYDWMFKTGLILLA